MTAGFLKRRLGFRTKKHGGVKRRAKKNSKLIKRVKAIVNATNEKKFLQVAFGSGNITNILGISNPVLYLLNGMTQGVTDNTRIGDRVRQHKLELNAFVSCTASTTQTYNLVCRIIRVKEPRGVAPTTLQIMNTATPNPLDLFNHVNVDWSSRFENIHEQVFTLTPQTATTNAGHVFRIYLPLGDLITDYSIGNAGTIADMDKNAIYLQVLSSDASNTSSLTVAYYLWYYDM